MKIETIPAFVDGVPEIPELLDAAYVVSCYETYVSVQGKYSGQLVMRLSQKIPMSINPLSGYVQGELKLASGLRVEITLTE